MMLKPQMPVVSGNDWKSETGLDLRRCLNAWRFCRPFVYLCEGCRLFLILLNNCLSEFFQLFSSAKVVTLEFDQKHPFRLFAQCSALVD